jgi:hypothetical protein
MIFTPLTDSVMFAIAFSSNLTSLPPNLTSWRFTSSVLVLVVAMFALIVRAKARLPRVCSHIRETDTLLC